MTSLIVPSPSVKNTMRWNGAHHGSEWTTEEDALAYLTDAALVGPKYNVATAAMAQSRFTGRIGT